MQGGSNFWFEIGYLKKEGPDFSIETENVDKKNVVARQKTVKQEEPLGPKYLPNKPAQIDPIKGKKTNVKYICIYINSTLVKGTF